MTTTLAVPGIEIVCPPWCRQDAQGHLADLGNYSGQCAHWSPEVTGNGWVVDFSTLTYIDGTPADDCEPVVYIEGAELSPADARALAQAILVVADQAEARS